jgi:hypothetical protein
MILKNYLLFLFFGGCAIAFNPLSAQTDSTIASDSIAIDSTAFIMPVEEVPLDEQLPEMPAGTWTFFGTSNISTNQSQFSNWQGGGQNSIALSTTLNLNLTYQSPNLTWETTLDAGYGLILQGRNGRWFKNDDRLEITTKVGKKASEKWFYTFLLTPSTQFQPG